ncbi:NAD-dependent succinate-semialdehyde dehydrogenase [bacterium]|nr:MAG: NAD-dependent succinate-semialdehyde dehydrogenase [bacterium]
MAYETINPATGELIESFASATGEEIDAALDTASARFAQWRLTTLAERAALMRNAATVLEERAADWARIMALEMGKPVSEGEAEARKCAWVCRYYADEAEGFLTPEPRESDGSAAWVRYDPLGPILAIMPWNFPFWQVFRFAAPALMAGNVGLLKHASNVPQCALAIEEVFTQAGFPEGCFRSLLVGSNAVAPIIADDRIVGVTLTGSNAAGEQVAAAGGRAMKKMVMELGGSDPFIVLEDADVAAAAAVAVQGRCLNTGQSCIAAKRFIVHEAVHDQFVQAFVAGMAARRMGDPMQPDVNVGPMARVDLRDELADQVQRSVAAGARVALGGEVPDKPGAWYPPTVLVDVRPGMAVADEETFGPVAAVMRVGSEEEALEIANSTEFGLGASLWTGDPERAQRLVPEIQAGAVFVNGMVKSDPRLPFGGVKKSGFGRELSREGIREWVNTKAVWVG